MTVAGSAQRRVRAPSRLLAAAAVAVAVLAAPRAGLAAGEAAYSEYQVKAAFLKNFVKFVEWPPSQRAITLCILGEDPFKGMLAGSDDVGGGRSLTYRRIATVRETGDCQVVFLTLGQRAALPELVAAVGARPVLTVGDGDGTAAAGLMLNFLVEDRKVRFEANLAPARRAGLAISSRLLGLAKTVHNPR
jgi:hypothetical protein